MAENVLDGLQDVATVKSLNQKEFEQVLSLELEEVEVADSVAYVNRITLGNNKFYVIDTGESHLLVRIH